MSLDMYSPRLFYTYVPQISVTVCNNFWKDKKKKIDKTDDIIM